MDVDFRATSIALPFADDVDDVTCNFHIIYKRLTGEKKICSNYLRVEREEEEEVAQHQHDSMPLHMSSMLH